MRKSAVAAGTGCWRSGEAKRMKVWLKTMVDINEASATINNEAKAKQR
jgi:hypothetical protein